MTHTHARSHDHFDLRLCALAVRPLGVCVCVCADVVWIMINDRTRARDADEAAAHPVRPTRSARRGFNCACAPARGCKLVVHPRNSVRPGPGYYNFRFRSCVRQCGSVSQSALSDLFCIAATAASLTPMNSSECVVCVLYTIH